LTFQDYVDISRVVLLLVNVAALLKLEYFGGDTQVNKLLRFDIKEFGE